jgi:hypothetical protein
MPVSAKVGFVDGNGDDMCGARRDLLLAAWAAIPFLCRKAWDEPNLPSFGRVEGRLRRSNSNGCFVALNDPSLSH